MADKNATGAILAEDPVSDAAKKQAASGAAELLEQAAQLLEKKRSPRSEKHYRLLAEDVRQIAARLAE